MQNKTGSMRFGMCNLSMVPVRFEPSHKSEMVTQLLFGELFEIIEKTAKILSENSILRKSISIIFHGIRFVTFDL